MKALTLRLSDDVHEELRKKAFLEHTHINTIVAQWIQDRLAIPLKEEPVRKSVEPSVERRVDDPVITPIIADDPCKNHKKMGLKCIEPGCPRNIYGGR